MSNPRDADYEDYNASLDAFLDGAPGAEGHAGQNGDFHSVEQRDLEKRVRSHPRFAADAELQAQIDEALRRQFQLPQPADSYFLGLTEELKKLGGDAPFRGSSPRTSMPASTSPSTGASGTMRPTRRAWWSALGAASAAAIGWALLTRPSEDRRLLPREPLFAPTPLATLYKEAVATGFEPYYECRDDARFAATFERRQGQKLRLRPMPLGSSMLGLSYPGGLSRDTTAMLCRVDDAAVMVFVDRAENDQPMAAVEADPQLHVFREVRDGLVYYEVTPLAEAQMTRLLSAE